MTVRLVTRRSFLSAAGSTLAWPLAGGFDWSWQPSPAPTAARSIVVFDEPNFPIVDAGPLHAIAGAVSTASVAELADALRPGALLVWRHGSAFPADAWAAIARFLDGGGSLLHVSGEPFTRPVIGTAGAGRRVEPRTLACLQALKLNQSYRLDASRAEVTSITTERRARVLPDGAWIAALEPRFAQTQNVPSESGSPGARDALLRPLAFARRPHDDARFPFAAAAYAIDRLRGPFAGGRWTFWLASTPPTDDEWTWLLAEAARPPVDFRADPTFGCFHDGERPSLLLRAHRPGATDSLTVSCAVAIDGPGAPHRAQAATLTAGEHGAVRVDLPDAVAPGLYRISVDGGPLGRATTGFWIFDERLFASGGALTFDTYTMRRDGRPEPVVGTTTMSSTVHRDFLFEPNAAAWDDTFAELAALKINAIRTGLWSGWRKVSAEPGVVDEAVIRALEAFYLTARRHGLPVIFNLFAFAPEDFGATDPYLDPRALEGQRAFVSTLASRMAPARELIWDLINEPSFESPAHLWSLRPSGSTFERAGFTDWLAKRYQPGDAKASPTAWRDVVRRRWRLRPDEPIDVPRPDDFSDTWVMGARRPYRALDFALFAQDAFEGWIATMRAALRDGGSKGAVTVGQDEAGLGTSPSPLFHHAALDFTCMHTWWNDDALLWDGLVSKASGTPLLIGETGIMQRQLLSGDSVRSPEDFANLLSRKIGYAFASGAFGVVQWCYETNPFMDSDNEAAIGVKRVDGSVKPEHRVLADAAAFVADHRERFDGYVEPDVALIVPTAEQLSSRSLAAAATRASVRTCYEDLRIRLRAVADHRADRDLGQPKAILLPACRSVSDACWGAIVAAVERGATLICSGWFETDDAGLPAERLGVGRRSLRMVETAASYDGRGAAETLRFSGVTPESWYAADVPAPRRLSRGAGAIVHHPLPIEWADATPALAAFYRSALTAAGVTPLIVVDGDPVPGLMAVALPFRDAWLIVAVNESSGPRRLSIGRPGAVARVVLDVPAARSSFAWFKGSGIQVASLSAAAAS